MRPREPQPEVHAVALALRLQLRDPRVSLADGPLVANAASNASTSIAASAAGTAAHFRLLLPRVVRCLRAPRRDRLFRVIRITSHVPAFRPWADKRGRPLNLMPSG